MRPVYVLSAARTPIGKFGGAFASMSAADLGTVAAKAALERSGLPAAAVGETIFGHARQAGGGPNTARQVSHRAGVPDSVPAFTVNKACASSLKALTLAALSIAAGENEVVLAGGTECMSATPYLLPRARFGQRMGETAENLVVEYGRLRPEQDAFAVESQRRAKEAWESGRFDAEIAPVEVPGKKGPVAVSRDEHPRGDTTLESLAKLPPVFDAENGTVHAGNSSGITDGAAALVLASEEAAGKAGGEPLGRLVAWASAGVEPERMGVGPVPALKALLARTGRGLGEIDLIELNEAFAAQVIACARELPLDLSRVNVNGGAIALGHPIGATGARMTTTLLHEMKRRTARRGVATLCVSGGMGMAVLFERDSPSL